MFKLIQKSLYALTIASLTLQGTAQANGQRTARLVTAGYTLATASYAHTNLTGAWTIVKAQAAPMLMKVQPVCKSAASVGKEALTTASTKLVKFQNQTNQNLSELSKIASDNPAQAAIALAGMPCLTLAYFLYSQANNAVTAQEIAPTITPVVQPAPQVVMPVQTTSVTDELIGYAEQVNKTAQLLYGHRDLKDKARRLLIDIKNATTIEQITELRLIAEAIAADVAALQDNQTDSYVIGKSWERPVAVSPKFAKERLNSAYQALNKENAKATVSATASGLKTAGAYIPTKVSNWWNKKSATTDTTN